MVRVDEGSHLGVAVATDGNGRFCKLDPYAGAQLALAEAYRNVACGGAMPLAVSDCLNFGSPEDPAVMWQFAETCRGLKDACVSLGVPVTGGNVSLYNQTGETAILPTPVVAVLGVIDDVRRRTPTGFVAPDEVIVHLGQTREELSGSEWAHVVHGHLGGRPPRVDLRDEANLARLLVEAARGGYVSSAHDMSEGGLSQALVESCLRHGIGATVSLMGDPFVGLFSESAGAGDRDRARGPPRLVPHDGREPRRTGRPDRPHRWLVADRHRSVRDPARGARPGLAHDAPGRVRELTSRRDRRFADRLRTTLVHRRQLLRMAGLGVFAPLLCGCQTPGVSSDADAQRIAYGDDPSQFGELSLPSGAPKGTVVLIHGGFWKAAYDLSLGRPLARSLVAHGWAAWNIEYRRVGNGGGDPETMDDVAAAIDALAEQDVPRRPGDRGRPLGRRPPRHLGGLARAGSTGGRRRSS